MPKTVEKPKDRDVEALMARFKQSAEDAVKNNVSDLEEVKERVEGKN